MMIEAIVYSFIFGFAIAFFIFRNQGEDTTDLAKRLKFEQQQHEKDLKYYKKLCQTLADENAEFRRKE